MSAAQSPLQAKFEDGKKYLVSGQLLNTLIREVRTNRILDNGSIKVQRLAGQGTNIVPVTADAALEPWDLVPEEDNKWSVATVPIRDGSDTWNGEIDCANPAASYSLGDGDTLAIQIDSLEPTDYEIVKFSSWPIQGDYLVELNADDAFERRLIPIWQVSGTDHPGSVPLGGDPPIYATRRIARVWPTMVLSYFQAEGQDGLVRVLAPDLAS